MVAVATKKGAKGLIALKSYARKHTRRKDLEAEVEKLKAECTALLPAVLRYFEQHGVDRQTIEGFTLSPRYELWASRAENKSQKDMYLALIETGLPDYATESMNHQGMSAHIREIYRELVDAENDKPRDQQRDIDIKALYAEIWARYPELEGVLEIREDLKVSVTKAKKSTARSRIKGVLTKETSLPRDVLDDRID